MANQFSKDKINFDTYERKDPESQVDWGKAAQDITKTFEGIRDVRQGKKDELENMITEQQNALNDIGKYDSPTLQQVALDASNDSANTLNDQANLMRRGLIKPHEMQKFKANQSSGWTQFKKNAENWNTKFNAYTERTTSGENSIIEQAIGEDLAGFNNLKNLQFMSNPETGEMSYARTDENGDVIPGESVSVNQMTNLLNQKVNAYDVTKNVLSIKDKLGTVITATIDPDGIRTNITTEEMSRAESDYFGTEAGKETLRLEAESMVAIPMDMATVLATNVKRADGKPYITDLGGELHDKFAEEHPGEDNPYIAMRFDGNQYTPEMTPEQEEIATDYCEKMIKNSLDIKETAKTQKIQATEYKDNAYTGGQKEKEKEKSSRLGDYEIALNDEDPKKRKDMTDKLLKKRNDKIKEDNKGKSDEEKTVLIKDIRMVPKETTTDNPDYNPDLPVGPNNKKQITQTQDVRVLVLENGDEIPLEGNTGDQINTLDLILNPDNNLTTDDIKDLAAGRDIDISKDVKSKGDKTRTQKGKTTAMNFDNPTIVGDEEYETSTAYLEDVFGDVFKANKYSATMDTDEGVADNWAAYVSAYFPSELTEQFQESKQPLTSNYVQKGDELPDGSISTEDTLVMTLGGRDLVIDLTDPNSNKKQIETWMIGIQTEEDNKRTTTGDNSGGGTTR